MRALRCFATLTLTLLPIAGARAASRNWVDRYISGHGHCHQSFSIYSPEPLGKQLEDWTDDDLAALKAALDRCDALPDSENGGGSHRWTVPVYQSVADAVHERQQRAAREEDAKASAREVAEQAQAAYQRRVAADKQATTARLAALQHAADAEADERKAAEARTAAVADEVRAATHLAEETEARAKAARAEAQARYGVEAARKRAADAEEQARNADAQARADRQAADKRFADAHPTSGASAIAREPTPPAASGPIDNRTPCSAAIQAFDKVDTKRELAIDSYINRVMRQADQVYVDKDQGGIIARMSRDSFLKIRMAAIENCRQDPSQTLFEASATMYDGVRKMEETMGAR